MKKLMVALTLSCAFLLQPLVCNAESLWQDNRRSSLFQDVKAKGIGDILTIIISESSNSTRSSSANNSKSADFDVSAGNGSLMKWLTAHGASQEDSFKASGNISNTNRFTANITVQVIGVQPNGNLLVAGSQSIKQNKDLQTITITGEIRPEDISSNNTILSTYVANADIVISGKGPLMRKQRQGILTQVLNFLF